MNQRIRELAEQAEMFANKGDRVDVKIMMEKFAELLIQKCADIGERYADGNYEIRNQILIHFGLEEPEE